MSATRETAAGHERPSYRWMHRWVLLTTGSTLVLLLAGAMVTSTGSGLAVPDWPLSYGRWWPPMVGGIFWEHGHRTIAGAVGILTLILAAWVWAAEDRRWVRWLALTALLAVVLQALLGGITVLWYLPPAVSIAHACLGQTFFCLVVALSVVTSKAWRGPRARVEDEGFVPMRRLAALTMAAVWLQLLVGAVYRHTDRGLLVHILWGLLVLGLCLWATATVLLRHGGMGRLLAPALLLGGLVVVQVCLGFAALVLRTGEAETVPPPLWWPIVRSLHVLVGATLLGTSVALWLRCLRFLVPGGRAENRSLASATATP